MPTFYHPDLGRFTSDRADLSDLAGKYYEVAKSAMAVRAEFANKPLPGCTCGTCRASRTFTQDEVQTIAYRTEPYIEPWIPSPEDLVAEYPIVKTSPVPPSPEKTEAERAWDYLVLAAEASRYNT